MESNRKFDLQLFAEGEGQPTAQPAMSQQTPTQQQPPATAPAQQTSAAGQTTGQPPEKETYTKEDVSRLIQTRLAEEKRKYQNYERLQALAQRLEKITGTSVDAISQQLDAYMQQMEAQQAGLPPEVHRELSMVKQASAQAYLQNLELQLKLEEQELKRDPLYADLDGDLRKAVYDYAKKNGVSLQQAYWAVNGPIKAQQLQREVEQRVLANQKAKEEAGVVTGDTSEEAKKLGLTPEQIAAAKVLGMEPAEYAMYAKIDNLEAYRKATKKKE